MNKKCPLCKSTMTQKGTNIVGGDTYVLLYCENCKHQCARSES